LELFENLELSENLELIENQELTENLELIENLKKNNKFSQKTLENQGFKTQESGKQSGLYEAYLGHVGPCFFRKLRKNTCLVMFRPVDFAFLRNIQ